MSTLENISVEISHLYHRENWETERRHVGFIKTNPKAFYKYANKHRQIKSKIGPLKQTDEHDTISYESGPKKMAEILNRQYHSVFTVPRDPGNPDA